ncbi:hypothetical protein BGZ61DRAFT_456660 [Ilyonectria robusta]|uniref:uncharacterized protein n=1 Tax=Ilyonectria robusta TaxID=1079257 RepID=UPI001E8E8EFB|nr:uncharacterized protein BGZ61DRAFT_456660 [Ilyonectria robusta]KAH8680406.1 hypothetical protein BGZ61DRAFT_456660 [Ilyonectria robusta]
MDKAVVLEAHPDIRNLAVRACHEHNESTFFKTSETGGMSMHEYNMTKTHAEIYDAFTKQHVNDLIPDLEKSYGTGALVRQHSPFIMMSGGSLRSQTEQTIIIIPLGYLRSYPSMPKPASGFAVVHSDGDYEPVVSTRSTQDSRWSEIRWQTGTYIRVPPNNRVRVEAGILFCLMASITPQSSES